MGIQQLYTRPGMQRRLRSCVIRTICEDRPVLVAARNARLMRSIQTTAKTFQRLKESLRLSWMSMMSIALNDAARQRTAIAPGTCWGRKYFSTMRSCLYSAGLHNAKSSLSMTTKLPKHKSRPRTKRREKRAQKDLRKRHLSLLITAPSCSTTTETQTALPRLWRMESLNILPTNAGVNCSTRFGRTHIRRTNGATLSQPQTSSCIGSTVLHTPACTTPAYLLSVLSVT
jgi:hypothetical protein